MIVTVPCMIGGKPFAVDDVVEVDEYTARALSAVKRAVACAVVVSGEQGDHPRSVEEAPADEGEKKGRKAKG